MATAICREKFTFHWLVIGWRRGGEGRGGEGRGGEGRGGEGRGGEGRGGEGERGGGEGRGGEVIPYKRLLSGTSSLVLCPVYTIAHDGH